MLQRDVIGFIATGNQDLTTIPDTYSIWKTWLYFPIEYDTNTKNKGDVLC